MREIKQLTNNRFLNIKEVDEPEYGVKGYQFAERRGVDSIAFICFDKNDHEMVLLNDEVKPPIGKRLKGAFGGSFDKDKTAIQIVIDEVREEAGFEVDARDIIELSSVMVSTQMNQFCRLFIIEVDRREQKERNPENACEELAQIFWTNISNVWQLHDWKPMAIIYLARELNVL